MQNHSGSLKPTRASVCEAVVGWLPRSGGASSTTPGATAAAAPRKLLTAGVVLCCLSLPSAAAGDAAPEPEPSHPANADTGCAEPRERPLCPEDAPDGGGAADPPPSSRWERLHAEWSSRPVADPDAGTAVRGDGRVDFMAVETVDFSAGEPRRPYTARLSPRPPTEQSGSDPHEGPCKAGLATVAEAVAALVDAGADPDVAETLAVFADRETSGWTDLDGDGSYHSSASELLDGCVDPAAMYGPNDNGSTDHGAWQINDLAWKDHFSPDLWAGIYDLATSAVMVVEIYEHAGGISPWCLPAYSGSYRSIGCDDGPPLEDYPHY